jgi:hypothetical protein
MTERSKASGYVSENLRQYIKHNPTIMKSDALPLGPPTASGSAGFAPAALPKACANPACYFSSHSKKQFGKDTTRNYCCFCCWQRHKTGNGPRHGTMHCERRPHDAGGEECPVEVNAGGAALGVCDQDGESLGTPTSADAAQQIAKRNVDLSTAPVGKRQRRDASDEVAAPDMPQVSPEVAQTIRYVGQRDGPPRREIYLHGRLVEVDGQPVTGTVRSLHPRSPEAAPPRLAPPRRPRLARLRRPESKAMPVVPVTPPRPPPPPSRRPESKAMPVVPVTISALLGWGKGKGKGKPC